jgi:hypothetical protein
MSYGELYVAERTMDSRVEENLHDANNRRLARQLRPPHDRALPRQFRWMVCKLGYQLVSLGAKLEQASMVQVRGLEGEMS